ncbi:hypothetical protein HK104_001845 [Borealophlyctis nickersoniae]|nr:hypothetical protein HK104_001845 [Borealophlyctis nickersoniae]
MTSINTNEKSKNVQYIQTYTKKDLYKMTPDTWNHRLEFAKDRMNGDARVVKTYYWYPSLEEFVEFLVSLDDDTRWYYEIIPGHVSTPMYFDIEWFHDCSAFPSPEAVIQEIIRQFDAMMTIVTSGTGDPRIASDAHWYILRSDQYRLPSGKVKFSYHLIYQPGYLFTTAQHRKRLFNRFVAHLASQNSPLCRLPDEHGGEKLLLDPSVYSNWQTLRTIFSTKLGSSRRLIPVDLNGSVLEVTADQVYPYFVRYLTGNETIFDLDFKYNVLSDSEIQSNIKHPVASRLQKNVHFDVSLGNLEDQLVTDPAPEVTMLENDRSIEFYLKCIPNKGIGQPWEIYFAIAAAVQRSANGTFRTFLRWAEASAKFNVSDAEKLWKSLSDAQRGHGYNERTLCRFAKRCAPWSFRLDNVEFHTRLPLRKYNNRYMEPLPTDASIIIGQSPMGSGKTYGMAKFIQDLNPKRVLLLSSRRTYAENATEDLNQRLPQKFVFQKYCNLDGPLDDVPFLTLQMESLHRVKKAQPYDILLIDEVEACLKQFSSPTMLSAKGRLLDNLLTFESVFKTAQRKVLLDAFISQRTIDFVETIMGGDTNAERKSKSDEEETEVQKAVDCSKEDDGGMQGNDAQRQESQQRPAGAMVIVNENHRRNKNAYQYGSGQKWQDELLRHIAAGKKVVVFWGSRAKGQVFEQYIRRKFPHLNVKFYHSESDDRLDKDLCNVRHNWKDVDVLMYTAKITVGVNFDTAGVFDSLFVYGAAGGCSAREVMQATMRVRHPRDNCIHYYVSGGYSRDVSVPTMQNLKALLAKKHKYLDDISQSLSASTFSRNLFTDENYHQIMRVVEWGEEKEFMVRIHLQNLLEEEQSRYKFSRVFRNFLKRAGYTCHFDPDIVNGGSGQISANSDAHVLFSDIPLLGSDQKDVLLGQKELTAAEKLMIKKYYFVLQFDNVPRSCHEVLWTLRTNGRDKARLDNLKFESVSSPENEFNRNVSMIQLKSFTPESTLQYSYLRKLLDVLGIRSSFDTRTIIPSSVVERLADNISHLQDPLETSFKVRERSSKENISKLTDKRKALTLVNKVLTAWSNSRLAACKDTRKQHKVDGKKFNRYDYRVENQYEGDLTSACGRPYLLSELFTPGNPFE